MANNDELKADITERGKTMYALNADVLATGFIYRITIDGGNLFDFKLGDYEGAPTLRRCTLEVVPNNERSNDTFLELLAILGNIRIVQPKDLSSCIPFSQTLGVSLLEKAITATNEWMHVGDYFSGVETTSEDELKRNLRPLQSIVVNYSTASIKIEPIYQNFTQAVYDLNNSKNVVQSLWDARVSGEAFIENITTRDNVKVDMGEENGK